MTKKVYRSSKGKDLDLGALQLRNEQVRAVGNMGVNARGEVINANNKVVESSTERTGKTYKKQTRRSNNVSDIPVKASKTRASAKGKIATDVDPEIVEQTRQRRANVKARRKDDVEYAEFKVVRTVKDVPLPPEAFVEPEPVQEPVQEQVQEPVQEQVQKPVQEQVGQPVPKEVSAAGLMGALAKAKDVKKTIIKGPNEPNGLKKI